MTRSSQLRSNSIFQSLRGLNPRRLLFVIIMIALSGVWLSAQPKGRTPPNRGTPGELSSAEAESLWTQFLRRQAIGSFYFEFELQFRPARLETQNFDGRFWGSWQPGDQRTRFQLQNSEQEGFERWLMLNGLQPELYHYRTSEEGIQQIPETAWFEPLTAELPLPPFFILMPYLYWGNPEYLGPSRVLGRPVHTFRLTNPDPDHSVRHADIRIDEDFYALLEAGFLNAEKDVIFQLEIRSLKKVEEEWIPRTLVWKNLQSRDTFVLKIQAAALGFSLPDGLLQPACLTEPFNPGDINLHRF